VSIRPSDARTRSGPIVVAWHAVQCPSPPRSLWKRRRRRPTAVVAVYDDADIIRCARLTRAAHAARAPRPRGRIGGAGCGWSYSRPPWACAEGRMLGVIHPPCPSTGNSPSRAWAAVCSDSRYSLSPAMSAACGPAWVSSGAQPRMTMRCAAPSHRPRPTPVHAGFADRRRSDPAAGRRDEGGRRRTGAIGAIDPAMGASCACVDRCVWSIIGKGRT
jgi:hypothetical protein